MRAHGLWLAGIGKIDDRRGGTGCDDCGSFELEGCGTDKGCCKGEPPVNCVELSAEERAEADRGRLDADRCPGMGSEGAAALAAALPQCPRLRLLVVRGCGLDEQAKAALETAASGSGTSVRRRNDL